MSACVLLLIDESSAMDTSVSRDPKSPITAAISAKSKSESIATAVNSLLNKLAEGPDFDIALVGYRSDGDGNVEVGSRWGGTLAGNDFVRTGELAAAPVSVEQRTRRVPGAGGILDEQTVDFPVWYVSELGDKAPQVAAFEHCQKLLADWSANAPDGGPPALVINITAGPSADGNPLRAVQGIQQMDLPGGATPLVMQVHLGSSDNVPPTLYSANRAYLTVGPMRDLFERVSVMPDSFSAALKENGVATNPKARGMIYNARMADVVRFLSLVQVHTADWDSVPQTAGTGITPDAPEMNDEIQPDEMQSDEMTVDATTGDDGMVHDDETTVQEDYNETVDEAPTDQAPADVATWTVTAEEPALIVFVMDRSVTDPYSGDLNNPCARLQEQLGDLVEQIVKIDDGSIDVGVISYGADAIGEPEVRVGLEGGLAGRPYARGNELEAGAVRIDEFQEEIPNGVGGLITIPHRRPILVEVEPTEATSAVPAFLELSQMLSAWCSEHPTSSMPPIVLHLTRGKLDGADLESGVEQLRADFGSDIALYHLVATEDEHASLSYPGDASEIADSDLTRIWEVSSGLLFAEQIAAEDDSVNVESRGLVINGKFNLLLDAIKRVRDLLAK